MVVGRSRRWIRPEYAENWLSNFGRAFQASCAGSRKAL